MPGLYQDILWFWRSCYQRVLVSPCTNHDVFYWIDPHHALFVSIAKALPSYTQKDRMLAESCLCDGSILIQIVYNLTRVLTKCDEFYSFCANKAFRKWRFKTYVYGKVALTKLCKRLTDGKKTCIGIGDWSRQDGIIKRHPTAPVKKIQKELHRRVGGACLF